ncbi:hypothetical protein KH5H1_41720 [Corallococcus caeni]|nr:hypothetical protein KH5H1_41720 [Corallococcus sp. KH5-1]
MVVAKSPGADVACVAGATVAESGGGEATAFGLKGVWTVTGVSLPGKAMA